MLRIPCPWCGPRDQTEFSYGGDAGMVRAPGAEVSWELVYLRTNPKGMHRELWHHVAGCRAWLIVTRDTVTHDIHSTAPASQPGTAGIERP